jgi:hypothetical protein
MDQPTKDLVDAIKELRKNLSSDGEYSIFRKDREAMPIWDVIALGNIFEKIDKSINELEVLNSKEISQETTVDNMTDKDEPVNMTKFLALPPGKQFAYGLMVDKPDGLFMTGSGRTLKWVAVKGYAKDWCIYTHYADNTWEFVQSNGDKVSGEKNIKRCVPCDDEVFAGYRY